MGPLQNSYENQQHNNGVQQQDAIRGSLLGGAIGDALGFPVEFMSEHTIFNRYGSGGIQAFEKDPDSGKALISDDTQMTLFTANGILFGITRGSERGIMGPPESYVALAYQDWLYTQTMRFSERQAQRNDYVNCFSWLADVPQLYSRRAPGNTCMSALRSGEADECSKGCGGVMRVAPIGLVNVGYEIEEADRIGAAVAALTHGHSLGFLPAAVLVHILHRIVYSRNDQTLRQIVLDARDTVAKLYAGDEYLDDLTAIINRAVELSENADSDLDNIHRLGEGWVGEEALAIALYCALRYPNDFSAGIIAAVNHRGDSDSTGAVTGNILGAWLGYDAIDDKWKRDLELRNVLLEMADDLAAPENTPGWRQKYIEIRPL